MNIKLIMFKNIIIINYLCRKMFDQILIFYLFLFTEILRTFTLVTDQFPVQGVSTQTRH